MENLNQIELSEAELHNPLFFVRRNWGTKLDVLKHNPKTITLTYDREHKELLIKCDGKLAIIPTANVCSMTPLKGATPAPDTIQNKTSPIKGKVKAQVSGPQDHVFSGTGAGKTRD